MTLRNYFEYHISADAITLTEAVDPVTVPSTCTMLAQNLQDHRCHAAQAQQLLAILDVLPSHVCRGCRRFLPS